MDCQSNVTQSKSQKAYIIIRNNMKPIYLVAQEFLLQEYTLEVHPS